MAKIIRFVLYLLVVAPACLCIYMIYTQASDAELRGHVDELKVQKYGLQKERDRLEGSVRSASELKAWEGRLTSKQLSLSNQVEIAELQEKSSKERAQKAEERANDAERRAKEADDRVQSKEAEIKKLEKNRDDLELKIANEKRQLARIAIDIASNTVVRSSCVEEVNRLARQVERDRAEYESVHSVVTNLQSQRIELLSAIRNKTKEYETLGAVVKGRIAETNRLSMAVTELEGGLEKIRAQVDGLKTTMVILSNEVFRLKSDKRVFEAEYRRLERLRLESAKSTDEATIAETNAVSRATKAEAEAKQAEAKLQEIKSRLEQLLPASADVGELLSQKKKLEDEVMKIEDDLNDKRNDLDEIEKRRTAVQEEVSRLNGEAKKVRDKLLSDVTNFTATVSKTLE